MAGCRVIVAATAAEAENDENRCEKSAKGPVKHQDVGPPPRRVSLSARQNVAGVVSSMLQNALDDPVLHRRPIR
jgi:hypothetical protein